VAVIADLGNFQTQRKSQKSRPSPRPKAKVANG
jgi:hypothetical protein